MATPEELIEVICPTLASSTGYSTYVLLATSLTSSGYFGDNYALAVALRASHMYMVNTKRNGESGYITQKQEGRLSKSFGGMGNITSELQMSSYGMQLQQLINACANGNITTTSTDIYDTYLGG